MATMKKLYFYLRNEYFLLIAIMALGLVLRLINLGAEPYWGDEVLSLQIVKHYQNDFFGLLDYLKQVEVHPPLYYILLKFWTAWFGYGEFAVRFLSLIFGEAIIWLVYVFGKRLFANYKVGLIAAFFIAILPMQIEYSQEARPYIIFCFFGALNVISLWEYLKFNDKKYLAAFILSGLTGIYLHYSAAFILLATFSWWLLHLVWQKKNGIIGISRRLLAWLAAAGAIFLGFYYWLPAFLYKMSLANFSLYGLERAKSGARSVNFFDATFN